MKIYISATLRGFFGRHAKVELEGNTVRSLLKTLTDEYPDGREALYNDDGKLREFIQIYVDDEKFTTEDKWDEDITANRELLLIPSIAGGAPTESLISDERRKEVSFDDAEIERFNKHLMLREIGVKGQKRIKAARVVIIGAGALGSPVIQYLAAAGIG